MWAKVMRERKRGGKCSDIIVTSSDEVHMRNSSVHFGDFKFRAHHFFVTVQYQRQSPGKIREAVKILNGWAIFFLTCPWQLWGDSPPPISGHPPGINDDVISSKNSNRGLNIVFSRPEWKRWEAESQHLLD